MSINSANTRRFAIAAGRGALAVGFPYGAVALGPSPESLAWALMVPYVCGVGFAGYHRSGTNRFVLCSVARV
jgi:hypothetical protein